MLDKVEDAIEDIKKGKVVIVVDDENRENEGDFVIPAEQITPEVVNFMVTHGRGLICAPITERRCEELDLDLMIGKNNNTDPYSTAFTISVDKIGDGVTTGISAQDRAKTIKALIDKETRPIDLGRPGHIFPLMARNGGVLRRSGHTEACIDLARLAGFEPAGAIVEVMNEDGTMARLPQLLKIAKKHNLKIISIENLISYRMEKDSLIDKIDEFPINTPYGKFDLNVFKQTNNNQIHFAITYGKWTKDEIVSVKVRSLTSVFNPINFFLENEKSNLEIVSKIIKEKGKGVYILINQNMDSNVILAQIERLKDGAKGKSIKSDEKDFGIGAQIINYLGIKNVSLITENEDSTNKIAISGYGIKINDINFINIK